MSVIIYTCDSDLSVVTFTARLNYLCTYLTTVLITLDDAALGQESSPGEACEEL